MFRKIISRHMTISLDKQYNTLFKNSCPKGLEVVHAEIVLAGNASP